MPSSIFCFLGHVVSFFAPFNVLMYIRSRNVIKPESKFRRRHLKESWRYQLACFLFVFAVVIARKSCLYGFEIEGHGAGDCFGFGHGGEQSFSPTWSTVTACDVFLADVLDRAAHSPSITQKSRWPRHHCLLKRIQAGGGGVGGGGLMSVGRSCLVVSDTSHKPFPLPLHFFLYLNPVLSVFMHLSPHPTFNQ